MGIDQQPSPFSQQFRVSTGMGGQFHLLCCSPVQATTYEGGVGLAELIR